jgi:hypothetical protein
VKVSFSRFSDRAAALGDWIGGGDALIRAESRFLVPWWNEFDIRYPIDAGHASNVKFENSTRIINLLVVLLFPTFALAPDANGMQMLEMNQ